MEGSLATSAELQIHRYSAQQSHCGNLPDIEARVRMNATHTWLFTAVLVMVVKSWKHHKCSSTGELVGPVGSRGRQTAATARFCQ